MVYVLLGTGFEEMEAIAPIDLLRRAGIPTLTVGVDGKTVYGGHNIGIDGHEFPDVGGANTMEILPGMCFSVEPGIYIPGKGGIRIEDLVVAREDGYHCFYTYPKKDIVIID